jgi:hypothetical protein
VRPFAYECEFDGVTNAILSLQEIKQRSDWIAARSRRVGEFRIADRTLELRSVHELVGSALTVDAPIGYVFERNGVAVGAIELNGLSPRLWLPVQDAALRRQALLAAVALAVLWDPAALH